VSRRWLLVLPLLVAAASCSSDDPTGPSAAVTTPPTSERTTTTLSIEQEVEAAYLRSWDVYAKAVRDLDPSGLEESYADAALELERNEVADLVAANTPVRVQVEHKYSINVVDSTHAVVFDRYRNHSVLLDAKTGHPAEPDPDNEIAQTYALRRIDGKWKVTQVERS
jgi:hypothetical protein